MKLREHPAMEYYGVMTWPPVLVNSSVVPTQKVTGEIGTLTRTMLHPEMPKRLFLRIEVDKQDYMGCLVFKDARFCQQLNGVLQTQLGRSLKEIGDLDLSHTL